MSRPVHFKKYVFLIEFHVIQKTATYGGKIRCFFRFFKGYDAIGGWMGSFFHFLAQSFLRQKMKKAPIHPPIASYQVKRGWLVTPYFSSVRCCFRY